MFRCADDARPGILRIAGNAAGIAGAHELCDDVVVNQIVCGGERAFFTHKIRCGNFIGSRLENFRESLIFRRFHGDLHHFPGSGVGRRRIQTGNVAELRADAAHLLDAVVHHFLEAVSRTGHMLRQRHGGIIGADHQQRVKQIVHSQLLAAFQIWLHFQTASRHLGLDAVRAGDNVVQIAVFDRHQRRDYLGKGTGGQLGIGVIGVDDRLGIRLIGEGRQRRIQPAVASRQRAHTVQGAAAVVDADPAEGDLGSLLLGGLRLLGRRAGFRGRRRNRYLTKERGAQEQA